MLIDEQRQRGGAEAAARCRATDSCHRDGTGGCERGDDAADSDQESLGGGRHAADSGTEGQGGGMRGGLAADSEHETPGGGWRGRSADSEHETPGGGWRGEGRVGSKVSRSEGSNDMFLDTIAHSCLLYTSPSPRD